MPADDYRTPAQRGMGEGDVADARGVIAALVQALRELRAGSGEELASVHLVQAFSAAPGKESTWLFLLAVAVQRIVQLEDSSSDGPALAWQTAAVLGMLRHDAEGNGVAGQVTGLAERAWAESGGDLEAYGERLSDMIRDYATGGSSEAFRVAAFREDRVAAFREDRVAAFREDLARRLAGALVEGALAEPDWGYIARNWVADPLSRWGSPGSDEEGQA